MITIVLGNIIAFIASLLMVYIGLIKQRKKIIYVQTIQIGLFTISTIVLGGITGAIINAISCIRNILCYKNILKTKEKTILIILSTTLSVAFNNLGVIGFLPLISSIVYTLLMDTKEVIKLKLLIMFTTLLWLIYDINIKSYSSAIFEFLTIISNITSIYLIKNKKQK